MYNFSMNTKQMLGKRGEDFACAYLKKKGYIIAIRNFRAKCGEIDIVAVKGGVIAFVEVKTRSGTDYGYPSEAVTFQKQHKLRRTAHLFLKINRQFFNLQPRMDVVEIISKGAETYINHIEGAF